MTYQELERLLQPPKPGYKELLQQLAPKNPALAFRLAQDLGKK